MKRHPFLRAAIVCLIVFFGSMARAIPAQENWLSRIAGDYLLDAGDRTLPFKILIVEGQPFFDAQIPGQDPQPMKPVAGKDLTYESVDPRGNDFVMAFIKDDTGKITSCRVTVGASGIEVMAAKVEKKAE
jgi:hypothetical protein